MASRKRLLTMSAAVSALLVFGTAAGAMQSVDPELAAEAGRTDQVYLEADSLVERGEGESYLARGSVRASYETRTVLADEVEYFPARGRVVARGNVRIFGEGEYAQTADEVELDEDLSEGVAFGFATMLENNGRAAAASAIRRANGSVELRDAYYTACALCEDGETPPTWRLRAERVVRDTDDQMIYYKDAQFEVMGVPVLYAPVFAHADPSSERRSGLLFPSFGYSSRLGAFYEQPYYWSISPYSDLVVAPRAMTNVNPILAFEGRKRFWSGDLQLEGSIGYDQEIDSDGDKFGDEDARWHLFGGGQFEINENWRWGFGVQRTSNRLQLRTYDFEERAPDLGGYLSAFNRRLVSQIYVENRDQNQYGYLLAADYQSLRSDADDDALPVIGPMGEWRRSYGALEGLGRVEFAVSGAVLDRDYDFGVVSDRLRGVPRGFTARDYNLSSPEEQQALLDDLDQRYGEAMLLGQGFDYARASAQFDWRTRFTAPGGILIEPFALGRADTYSIGDIPVQTGEHLVDVDDFFRLDEGSISVTDADFSRAVGLVGTEISWPFYRPGETVDWIVEPVVQGVMASDDPLDDESLEADLLGRTLLINEDSLSIDAEDSLILRTNRSSGYDAWEEGSRLAWGLRATAQWGQEYAGSFTAFAGQSRRLSGEPAFLEASGLFRDESDYIIAGELDLEQFRVSTQARFNSENWDLSRIDADVYAQFGRLTADLRYLSFSDELSTRRFGPQSELIGAVDFDLTDRWSAIYTVRRDMEAGLSRRMEAGLQYEDDCTQFQLLYEKEDFGGEIGASESIKFRVTLFTLGSVDDR